jgi:hypothetical protein
MGDADGRLPKKPHKHNQNNTVASGESQALSLFDPENAHL